MTNERGYKNSILVLTCDELRRILRYNPETGDFFWLVSLSKRAPVGKKAGWVNTSSAGKRIKIAINNNDYMAHRLAWLYMTGEWPKYEIDHINMDGTDNSWKNLREATSYQNQCHRGIQSNNKSGVTGVCWDSKHQDWIAFINKRHIGHFKKFSDAVKARKNAVKKLHGEFSYQRP
ncbi:MAG: HNH endonuclease [Patescibacteria group bacterium]|nr:HNH endonuclease [Patescibacteria group bacterium]